MSRYTKTQVTQLSANEQAAIDNINKNFNDIQEAINDTVSRSGNTPTHMTHDLDMNGKRIINLPAPKTDTDPVRRQDVVGDIALVQSLVNATTNAAAQTLKAAADVQEIIQDQNVGLVADDLGLGENSKIRQVAENKDNIDIVASLEDDIATVVDLKDDIPVVVQAAEDIDKVEDIAEDITAVANNSTNINAVAGNESNINIVASNSEDVSNVAINMSDINDCADNMAAISGASTQAQNAASSANSAAQSAQLAQEAALSITNGYDLLDHKWSDHLLNDQNWLRADTFSWHPATTQYGTYLESYNHLLNDIGYVRYMIPDDGFDNKFYRSPSEDTTMFAWTNQYSTLYTESEFPENGDNFYYHDQIFGTVLSTGAEAGGDVVTPTTETVGSYTITYYPAEDGHKIVLSDQETTVLNIYNESGVAWYYILDTANQRFKLPRENPVREELIQVVRAKGSGKTLGLTDGTETVGLTCSTSQYKQFMGTYQNLDTPVGTANGATQYGMAKSLGVIQDANKSGIISDMKDSTSVYKGKQYLYFYVGQYSQSATEQTAGLNSELFNDKADTDLNNTSPTLSFATKLNSAGIRTVVETYGNSSNSSWYRLYSDGWCEQGGNTPSAGDSTINLLKSYATNNYGILTQYYRDTNYDYQNSIRSKTASSFVLNARYANGCWYAYGYTI